MIDLFTAKYTTTDVAKLDIKRERLKEWMFKGFVKPSIVASGPGTKNLFTLLDLYSIALFAHVVNYGFSREEAAFRIAVFTRSQRTLMDDSITFGPEEAFSTQQKGSLKQFLEEVVESPFLVFQKTRDEEAPELFRFLKEGEKYDPGEHSASDDVLIVNFKKIRAAVDSVIL